MVKRHLLTLVMIIASLAFSGNASAQSCQPGIQAAFAGPHGAVYTELATALAFQTPNLTALLGAVVDEASYQNLLSLANALATFKNGRVLVTLPDGTVVVDTARNDGPGNPKNNTYENFQNKTINENHNSRVAILSAQMYPCGVAVETKTSTSTGEAEDYVAYRLGTHLDSQGTARLSRKQ